jgi:hypothetical protein
VDTSTNASGVIDRVNELSKADKQPELLTFYDRKGWCLIGESEIPGVSDDIDTTFSDDGLGDLDPPTVSQDYGLDNEGLDEGIDHGLDEEHDQVLWLRADANGSPSFPVRVRVRAGTAAATATCDFLLRILATCEKVGVFISTDSRAVILPLSGAGLTRFFQESRSCLRRVTLNHMDLSEDPCSMKAGMQVFK